VAEVLGGAAIVLWVEWAAAGDRRGRSAGWVAVAVWWFVVGQPIVGGALTALVVLQWLPDAEPAVTERMAVCRFWQTLTLLAGAGIPLLAAMEEAAPPTAVGVDLTALGQQLSLGVPDAVDRFVRRHPSVEARQVADLLRGAWDHGLDLEAAHSQGLVMWERLAQEDRLREAKRPLWTAALPGVLLLMVLVVFLVPIASFLVSGWSAL